MTWFDIGMALLLTILILVTMSIIIIISSYKKSKKQNHENELSRKIVYRFDNEKSPELTEMIDFHRNSKEKVRYKLED